MKKFLTPLAPSEPLRSKKFQKTLILAFGASSAELSNCIFLRILEHSACALFSGKRCALWTYFVHCSSLNFICTQFSDSNFEICKKKRKISRRRPRSNLDQNHETFHSYLAELMFSAFFLATTCTICDFHNFGITFAGQCTVCLKG